MPGESVTPNEADARIGWLLLTYITSARTALQRGDALQKASDTVARARTAVAELDRRGGDRSQRALLERLTQDLNRAQSTLTMRDYGAADAALLDAEQALRPSLVELDRRLFPLKDRRSSR